MNEDSGVIRYDNAAHSSFQHICTRALIDAICFDRVTSVIDDDNTGSFADVLVAGSRPISLCRFMQPLMRCICMRVCGVRVVQLGGERVLVTCVLRYSGN